MARDNTSAGSASSTRRSASKARFDTNGVRKAAIALLTSFHQSGRHGTLAEVLVALEVIDAAIAEQPHTMKSLAEKLGIPYTSVSRIVFSLTSEAAPGGLLRLVPDTEDRRRKHIEVDFDVFKQSAPPLKALEKAMVDYYGDSVLKLEAKAGAPAGDAKPARKPRAKKKR